MKTQTRPKTVTVDRYTRFCLTAIAVLLTVLIVGLWADGVPPLRGAGAAEPTRYQPQSTIEIGDMVRTQERTNEKLDQIIKLLEGGSVKVQVVQAAEAPSGGKPSETTPSETQTQTSQ